MTISPERLAAYADGELDHVAVCEVEAELARHPELRLEVERHRALKRRLAAHFDPIANEPVPKRLLNAVQRQRAIADVIDFGAARQKRRSGSTAPRWARVAVSALAASLVVALVGFETHSSGNYARGQLAAALDDQLVATQRPDAPVHILLSFRNSAGAFCRGYSEAAQSGIACRAGGVWRIVKRAVGAGAQTSEYRQAASPETTIMAAMQVMAKGAPLDATAEADARQRHWHAS